MPGLNIALERCHLISDRVPVLFVSKLCLFNTTLYMYIVGICILGVIKIDFNVPVLGSKKIFIRGIEVFVKKNLKSYLT